MPLAAHESAKKARLTRRAAAKPAAARAALHSDRDQSVRPSGLLQNGAGLFVGGTGCRGHYPRQFRRCEKGARCCRNSSATTARSSSPSRATRSPTSPKSSSWQKASSFSFSPTMTAYFDHAIAALPYIIAQIGADQSVVGITGTYAIELASGSAAAEYKTLDSDDPATRVAGFLSSLRPEHPAIRAGAARACAARVSAF